MTIPAPRKPFANYKWRWATLTPTESLNDPAVLLGVLRVFHRFNHQPPSSPEVSAALQVVQTETKSPVNLVRTPERNLLRNSGQYWKALGLLEDSHGKIAVSPFGILLARGQITQLEFATTVVKTLELPNRHIQQDCADWDAAGIKIKPLELILDILSKLSEGSVTAEAFITPTELIKITIPLAGANTPVTQHVEAIKRYRDGTLDISGWPNCAPNSNDARMAEEFLLFLCKYDFCKQILQPGKDALYYLSSISQHEIEDLRKFLPAEHDLGKIAQAIRETQIPSSVSRKKVAREILERPYQNIFRKNVLIAYHHRCAVTNVDIVEALEASHIVPVSENGTDLSENGLCLRSDIHQLFDSGHLRIFPNGKVWLSELAARENNYRTLPSSITLPTFVNTKHLEWRLNYY